MILERVERVSTKTTKQRKLCSHLTEMKYYHKAFHKTYCIFMEYTCDSYGIQISNTNLNQ